MNTNEIDEATKRVENEFSSLNIDELNWKPGPEIWSIAQCLDHLVISNGKYYPAFRDVINGTYKNTFWERINPLANYTGKNMIKTLGPDLVKKYKAPLIFKPSKSTIGREIISVFAEQQEELKKLIDEIIKKNKTGIKISSPVASLITLTTGDAIKLIVVHEQRHLNQALSLKKSPGFGKGNYR